MEAGFYQEHIRNFARYPKDELGPYFSIYGIQASTGKIANFLKNNLLIKGSSFDKNDIAYIKEEAGDLLWYLVNLCSDLDINIDDVMENNLSKSSAIYDVIKKDEQLKSSNERKS